MKDLVFISSSPDDLMFSWQYELFIENVRELGYTEEIQILLFIPTDRLHLGPNPKFKELEKRYKDQNVKFFWYPDDENLLSKIREINYIPLLRPHTLKKHFQLYPELEEKALFYHDSDILFTKYFDFSPFLEDDICYLSDTHSYLNLNYLLSKERDVIPQLLPKYQELDMPAQLAALFGITKQTLEDNNFHTGGAQYILKNINWIFWEKVEKGCVDIRKLLYAGVGGLNYHFFPGNTIDERENAGTQSWCSDMHSILYMLWYNNQVTRTPKTLDFVWHDTPISQWDNVNIYHHTGVNEIVERDPSGNVIKIHKLFNKRDPKYVNNLGTPFEDDLSWVSKDYCSYKYVEQIEKVRNKYYK